ncbi:unnamed protein product, partial [Iphiclides podalirius]
MNRRRGHEEEDGYDRVHRKRRRVSENQEIEDRLESLILRVGEKSSSSLESNLEGLASVLEADLSTFRVKILRILTECAIRMPEKCTIYATLVDSPHLQEEYLDCLWAQIKKLRQDNWSEKHIPRPYLAFDSILCEALQHTLPSIQPPPHNDGDTYPMPRVIFRMFDYTDCPDGPVLPGAHSIERFLIEEHLHNIIEAYHLERKECAAQLLCFPYKAKIPLEYCIVEPSTMPQVLAQATEILFMRIDTMNVACFDRFANWFAYHLSNFQYRWSWEDWEGCIQLDPEHPKPRFIREVLGKCLRLSYHQRVKDMIPETLAPLVPLKPEPIYKYSMEGAEYRTGN